MKDLTLKASIKPKKAIPKWYLYLFLLFLILLPYTKLSVPSLGRYELTLGDLVILVMGFISLSLLQRIDKKLGAYLQVFFLFLFTSLCSLANTRDYYLYFLEYIPFLFGFVIVFVVLNFFSFFPPLEIFIKIKKVLIFSLFIAGLPVYYQLIVTGVKDPQFYDNFGWRYVFLCQNPNQFGVYVILYFFIIALITLKYQREKLSQLFFINVYFLTPVFFSGSRTASLVFVLNLLLVMGLLFLNMTPIKKIIVAPIVVLLIAISFYPINEYLKTQGGQINRAISIFKYVDENRGIKIEGDTGRTIEEGKALFKKYPITGVGLGNKKVFTGTKTEIHNTYIKFLAESGLIGFLGFFLIFFLPLIAMLFSRSSLLLKAIAIGFYLLWMAMNIPHMLLRQRWVWFFMIIMFIIARVNRNGTIENSRLKFLN